jgi:hypothetical protein
LRSSAKRQDVAVDPVDDFDLPAVEPVPAAQQTTLKLSSARLRSLEDTHCRYSTRQPPSSRQAVLKQCATMAHTTILLDSVNRAYKTQSLPSRCHDI